MTHVEKTKEWVQNNRQRVRDSLNARRARLKIEVLTRYGGGTLACRCGYGDVRALSLDHLDGKGAAERRARRSALTGVNFYRFLKALGFPPGYETTCMNCQFIRRVVR